MNYNARDDENDSRAIHDAEIDEGRNQEKSIKCWWLIRPLVSRKEKGKERELQEEWKTSCRSHEEAQKLNPSLKPSASTAKEMVTGSGTAPNIWRIRRMTKWTSIFDIQIIEVYLTSVHSSTWVFDTSSVAKISNSKHELQNERRLVKGEAIYVGSDSKVDKITVAHSLYLRD